VANHYKIAGVVVLYNPDHQVIDNIQSYISQIEFLTIVDNSERVNELIFNSFKNNSKIFYLTLQENVGVAKALNIGADYAIAKQCDFLLTMDQDSSFSKTALDKMIHTLYQYPTNTIGILSPYHHFKERYRVPTPTIQESLFCMTSGGLLNLHAYKKAGKFLESLFIDHVDHEYGMRLNAIGYKVILVNDAELVHCLGTQKAFKCFGIPLLHFISHSPTRCYYMIRNGLYIANLYKRKYPQFYIKNIKLLVKEILKTILLEDDKITRIVHIYRGIKDYQNNRMGKLMIN
jgi:rhamnosyltransferase